MDQIANMINMVKNGGLREHETVVVPFSKMKNAIAECLVSEGFLKGFSKKTKKGFPVLELELMYVDGAPKVVGAERVSKSSRRVYTGAKEIRFARGSHGLTVMSTPKGIMTDKQAKKELVGGEVLFKLW
ncbi:MAG: 30S ribosomal protein S8 [Candidatus Pacebacteria bacterium]|jgi:small subunit ribosomal protein S8|nr:30S ribosomal protein S8 [Candidatus Paceibacterota bacterium]